MQHAGIPSQLDPAARENTGPQFKKDADYVFYELTRSFSLSAER